MLFTLVEPHPGCAVSYNRWYERDHFYAGGKAGPGCLSGRRWVATRRLKSLRFPAPSVIVPTSTDGSLLSLYWIQQGRRLDFRRWAADAVQRLDADGRMYKAREHVHTVHYLYRWG